MEFVSYQTNPATKLKIRGELVFLETSGKVIQFTDVCSLWDALKDNFIHHNSTDPGFLRRRVEAIAAQTHTYVNYLSKE